MVAIVIAKNISLNFQFSAEKAYAAKADARLTPITLKTAIYKVLSVQLRKLILVMAIAKFDHMMGFAISVKLLW